MNDLRPIKISDASWIIKEGLLSSILQKKTKTAAEDLIRSFIDDRSKFTYVYGDCLILRMEDSDSSEIKLFYCEDIDEIVLFDALQKLIKKAFFRDGIYRIYIKVSCSNQKLFGIIEKAGFLQEAVLHDEFLEKGKRVDGGLFYLLMPEYGGYNCVFVPFQRGVLAVRGGNGSFSEGDTPVGYVDSVSFLSYMKPIEDTSIRLYADYQGLTDDDGCLLPRGSEIYSCDPSDLPFMPSELLRAFNELKEYFLKRRDSFDINIRLDDQTTGFQKEVWEQLKNIPYGMTVSYEDIALRLTDGDIKKARKLTRAVGMACSDNPVPILIPCHRVIGKNGKLVGFSGGIEFKDFLLQNELFAAALPLN